MSKVSLLLALPIAFAFTNANAPTSQWLRDLPTAMANDSTFNAADYAHTYVAYSSFGQELSEEGALDRFEIDDFFLPRLNVELPELFDWSDVNNTYLAHGTSVPALSYGSDTQSSDAFRFASIGYEHADPTGHASDGFVGMLGGGSSHGGGFAHLASSATASNDRQGKGGSSIPQDPVADGSTNIVASNTPNTSRDEFSQGEGPGESEHVSKGNEPVKLVDIVAPVDDKPVDVVMPIAPAETIADAIKVPAPGAFGLFVLGLAGMRLARRKKNGSG